MVRQSLVLVGNWRCSPALPLISGHQISPSPRAFIKAKINILHKTTNGIDLMNLEDTEPFRHFTTGVALLVQNPQPQVLSLSIPSPFQSTPGAFSGV